MVIYGGGIFACRKSHQFAYPSQREDPADRAARRMDRLHDHMAGREGVLEGLGQGKPKKMHRRIYQCLCDEHDVFEYIVTCGFNTHFGLALAHESPSA